jgi:hypothetical protein
MRLAALSLFRTHRTTSRCSSDPARFEARMITSVARVAMRETWRLFTLDLVAPALTAVLTSGDDRAVADGKKLIHVIGERGYDEFGRLL